MRSSIVIACLLALGGVAGADENIKLLQPITYQQLTVFPVVRSARVPAQSGTTQYLTLSDGLRRKLVTVSEVGSGGSVNTLEVRNDSDRPLLVLGGEVVLGGQQDRILGQDTIVGAREHKRVPVFCVEHGRWSGGRQFARAQGMADTKIRVRAKYKADQSAVWAEVAKKNAEHGLAPATGTYRNLAAGDEGKKALAPYRAAIGGALDKLADKDRVVGVVAAVNGRVTSVELFARPELFAAYRDKLLDSIYMGAADSPVDAKLVPPKPEAVDAFMKERKVLKSSLKPSATAAPVYESFQADE